MKQDVKNARRCLGADYQGQARIAEKSIIGVSDSRITFGGAHTKKEKLALEVAEEHLEKAAKILRAVGNRMEGGA